MITTGGGGQHDASTVGSVCAELANTGCAQQWASRASRAGEAPRMRQWERPLQHASRSSSSAVVTWPLAGLAPLPPFLPAAPAELHQSQPAPSLDAITHQHTRTFTHTLTFTHTHTLSYTYTHAHTHSHSHSNTHTDRHTNTLIHAETHTH